MMMAAYLIDTNVVSELTKAVPNANVATFLLANRDLWLSSVVLHELEYGVRLLPIGKKRSTIERVLAELIQQYSDRIIPLEKSEALAAAELRAAARTSGRVLHFGDALIAGTARAHKLTVATRNVGDFEGFGVPVCNPWEFHR